MKVKESKLITFNNRQYLAVLIDNFYYEVSPNHILTYKKICYSKESPIETDNGELN
jgi:hypothetical protein|nr:MAG TPA: hypothetical protein [Crassvirales sp.]